MKKIPRKLWLSLGAVVVLILAAALALPFLVDVDRFRGLIEARAEEALGREVRMGEIRLSILPAFGLRLADVAIGALPEEGGGDLVTAASLRVGARLLPLLGKRLEVTSIVLEEPRMVLSRDREGRWNVERLVAEKAPGEAAPDGGPEDGGDVSIDSLRLTGGRLTIRDASGAGPGGAPGGESAKELVLADLDLELEDFRPGSTASFRLETAFESAPGARLELSGEGGPVLAGEGGDPLSLGAELALVDVTGTLLADLAGFAGISLEGAIGERAFDASGRLEAGLGAGGRVELSGVEIDGIDLVLARDPDGVWNVERIAGDSEPAEGDGMEIAIDSLKLSGGRLTVRDAAASQSRALVLADLGLELADFRPGGSSSFRLETAFESAPGARLEVSGEVSLASGDAAGGRLEANIELEKMGGKLLADLAAAAGVSVAGALGERPLDASARVDADLGPGGGIDVAGLTLSGAELDLRRDRDGRWNFELADSAPAAEARPVTVSGITVDGARIRVRDASAGAEPFDVVLDDLRLELDRLPTDGPANLRLTSGVEGEGGRGSLEVSGTLGPLGEDAAPVELAADLRQLPLAIVRPLVESLAGSGSEAGKADLALRLGGRFPADYTAAGSLDLAAAKVATDERTFDLDLGVRFDLAGRRGARALDFQTLELDVEGSTLSLQGSVEQVDAGRRWDMSLAPTRLPAEDLAALLELLVADFSMSFASETPLAIEARVTGLETAEELPELQGRLELKGFDFSHPSLARPIEKVDADVAFEGESVWVTGLAASVGGSQLAGDLTLTGFERPRVTFDLRSPRADLGEVLSAFESAETEAAPAAETGPSLLELITADGDLTVADGSWESLEFTGLTARARLAGGVLTLDPVALELYDGAFEGRVVADLLQTPAAFEIEGDARSVDLAPFLAANLEVEDALFGRFTGEVSARGAGDDYDSIVASLTGGGSARLDDGRLGRLDLLGTVARVSGVLGQRTLASVADRIVTESTRFERLEGKFELAGGRLEVTELILESPDFGLEGSAEMDLLASTVGGRFQLAFSELLSDSMQREASRAGELFWNPDTRRVVMPLALAGSVEAPVATVDWESAVQRYATGRFTGLLTGLLGGGEEGQPSGTPPPDAGPEPEPWDSLALEAEITRVRWGGSVLLQDLKLEGRVRGREIEQATLVAVDASGAEVKRIARLGAVDAFLAGADPQAAVEISWDARVDGKDLVLAAFPLTVTVTVTDRSGQSASASATVEK